MEFVLAKALDHLQPGTPKLAAVDLDRAGDQHLADTAAARGQNYWVVLGMARTPIVSAAPTRRRMASRRRAGPIPLPCHRRLIARRPSGATGTGSGMLRRTLPVAASRSLEPAARL
jgi:hypothetical protein